MYSSKKWDLSIALNTRLHTFALARKTHLQPEPGQDVQKFLCSPDITEHKHWDQAHAWSPHMLSPTPVYRCCTLQDKIAASLVTPKLNFTQRNSLFLDSCGKKISNTIVLSWTKWVFLRMRLPTSDNSEPPHTGYHAQPQCRHCLHLPVYKSCTCIGGKEGTHLKKGHVHTTCCSAYLIKVHGTLLQGIPLRNLRFREWRN